MVNSCQNVAHFGMSFSLFHAENLTTPGVEMTPLYRPWFGLASGKPASGSPPRPRLAALPEDGRLRISDEADSNQIRNVNKIIEIVEIHCDPGTNI